MAGKKKKKKKTASQKVPQDYDSGCKSCLLILLLCVFFFFIGAHCFICVLVRWRTKKGKVRNLRGTRPSKSQPPTPNTFSPSISALTTVMQPLCCHTAYGGNGLGPLLDPTLPNKPLCGVVLLVHIRMQHAMPPHTVHFTARPAVQPYTQRALPVPCLDLFFFCCCCFYSMRCRRGSSDWRVTLSLRCNHRWATKWN